jgi:LysR family glycine cleavage system transcriptional activator
VPLSRRLMPSTAELVAFEAAARHANFTRAAEELSLTQGAISKQIRQLEQTLGVTLFERVNRRVVLTDAGGLYLGDVREMLTKLETSTHAVLASGGSAAVLNVAVLPTFATRWLVPRLPMFVEAHPGVTINLATRLKPFDFDEEPFDLAIHYGTPTWPRSDATHLFDENVVPVASPAYRTGIRLAAPGDLLRATLLQQATRPTLWRDWFESVGVEHIHPYRGPLFDQFSMIAQAAAAGLGAALVPRFLVEEELQTSKLVVLFDHPLRGSQAYYLVVPTRKIHTPVVAQFGGWLAGEARRR